MKNLGSASMLSCALAVWCIRAGICNYLFISMSPQLYIPGQHYSLLTFYYNILPIQNK